MAGKSVLLVVGIVEARQFPSRAGCLLVVEGRLGREGLATDPVLLDRGSIKIGQELAWSMTRKALQQHRVQRSPLKLQVYALDKASNVRQLLGYALLDIRTARVGEQKPSWCSLLGPGHTPGSRPQLLVSLSLEEEEEEERQHTEGGGAGEEQPVGKPAAKEGLAGNTAQHTLTLTLAEGGGYYTLGPPSSHQHTFTLSLTLTNPSNIPQPPVPGSQLYFYYCLLGNDITSEPFVATMFQPERASIRVHSSQELLHLLMSAQEDMELHLCSGPQSLAHSLVPLKLLGTRDHAHLTLQLGAGGGTTPLPVVDVTLQLECDSRPPSPSPHPSITAALGDSKKPTTPTPVGPVHPHAHTATVATPTSVPHTHTATVATPTSVPHTHTVTVAGRLSTSPSTEGGAPSPIPPPYPRSSHSPHTPSPTATMNQSHTAKRNLTKSFEEADSSPATPTALQGTHFAHQPPSTAQLATPTTQVQTGSAGVHLRTAYPFATSTFNTLPTVSTVAHPPTLTHPSTVAPPLTVTAGASLGSESPAKAAPANPHKTTICRNMGVVSPANSTHHFRFSIDTRSIHNVNMGEGLQCYLRYNYPFFGSTHPVLVTPPVAVNPNTECTFSQSYCAFDFATSPHQLVEQLHSQPLSVEVWHSISSPGSHNQLVGIAKVPLSEVLSKEKIEVGGASRQLCALRVPIIPMQPHTTTPGLALPHSGYLHTVLVLEDCGSVGVVGAGGDTTEGEVQRERTGQTQLITAQEYQAALELEMWKLSQEEAWQADLRGREANHMSRLAAEWHRRDQQRQQLLREKLSVYSSLEQQLQGALKEVQLQRQQLKDKEGELSLERSLLTRDRQSLQDECGRRLREVEESHQQQLLQERYKAEQFENQVTRLKSQVEDLEGRCVSKEAEFEAYRRQVSTRPESRLQAELSMAQLEKGELERRLSSALRSKQHYKEQWSNALKELASLRQREQAAARQHLHKQQEELEALRVKFLQQREHQQLKTELSSARTQLQELQERTMARNSTEQEMPSSDALPLGGGAPPSGISVDPAVARWIEERDILLQTGVYSSNDPTIARLDQKIREALPMTHPLTNLDL